MSYYKVRSLDIEPFKQGKYCAKVSISVEDIDGAFAVFDDIYVSKHDSEYHVDATNHKLNGYKYVDDEYGDAFPDYLADEIIDGIEGLVSEGKLKVCR